MISEKLIESFTDFAKSKNIDKPAVIRIIEDVLKTMIKKKFNTDNNFDIIINLDKNDLQICKFKEIVDDNSEDIWDDNKMSLSEARKIEPDFEIGEQLTEEINLEDFGRREINSAKQILIFKIKDLEKNSLYHKYSKLLGEMITVEVHQVLNKQIILLDDEKNELILPKLQQIPKDHFKKGDYIRCVIHKVDLKNNILKIILSRTSSIFLERLLESEVPEIFDGLISIKKIVRDPGKRAKVSVESYDDRIDPVGACVGVRGVRIHSIVRELQNENIDIINYTNNLDLYISRAISPAKISNIKKGSDRIIIYLKSDQVSLAIGKSGQNIRLASRIVEKPIDIYRELDSREEDVNIEEFVDEIDQWIIDELKILGFDTAKSILSISKEDFETRVDLEKETIEEIYKILQKEFE